MTWNCQSGWGCRSFGLGNQRAAISIIFRHVSLLAIAASNTVLQAAHRRAGYVGSRIFHNSTR